MPSRFAPILGGICGFLLAAYLVLLGSTVFFAALQTELSASVHDTEAAIALLEHQFLGKIAAIQSTDPSLSGFVRVSVVRYATVPRTDLSRAAR